MKTYSEQIADYIRDALLRGEFVPGDKVNEVRLASALSISRAPVREALQMLVREGLIVAVPQRGKFIPILSAKEIEDNYDIGGVLEGAAVRAGMADLTVEDYMALEDALRQMAGLDEAGPEYAVQIAAIDVAFHEILLGRSPNRLMADYARTVCRRMSKFLFFRHWPKAFSHAEVVVRHKNLFKIVRDASSGKLPAERVEGAVREHYRELGKRMAVHGGCSESALGDFRSGNITFPDPAAGFRRA